MAMNQWGQVHAPKRASFGRNRGGASTQGGQQGPVSQLPPRADNLYPVTGGPPSTISGGGPGGASWTMPDGSSGNLKNWSGSKTPSGPVPGGKAPSMPGLSTQMPKNFGGGGSNWWEEWQKRFREGSGRGGPWGQRGPTNSRSFNNNPYENPAGNYFGGGGGVPANGPTGIQGGGGGVPRQHPSQPIGPNDPRNKGPMSYRQPPRGQGGFGYNPMTGERYGR